MGCESKIDSSIASYSVFPQNYNIIRKDRDKNGEVSSWPSRTLLLSPNSLSLIPTVRSCGQTSILQMLNPFTLPATTEHQMLVLPHLKTWMFLSQVCSQNTHVKFLILLLVGTLIWVILTGKPGLPPSRGQDPSMTNFCNYWWNTPWCNSIVTSPALHLRNVWIMLLHQIKILLAT